MEFFDTIADKKLSQLVRNGAVGVMPTDTVYGVVAAADNEAAVQKLYALKKRKQKPGTLIAANIEQLVELGLKARYLKAVEQYWPGPITIIIPTGPELAHLHQGKYSIGVRIPADEALQALLHETGPLMTTSANQPGKSPASMLQEAKAYFGDQVDFYVDGGDLSDRQASTIIRMVDDAVEVLREGAVKIDEATGKVME